MPRLSIILFIGLQLFAISCLTRSYAFTTTSPRRTYTVNLTERQSNSGSKEPYRYSIGLKVMKQEEVVVDEPRFSGRDEFDRRFGDEYQESEWLSENVLRLGSKQSQTQGTKDIIYVRNGTSQNIAYLMIKGKSELFLTFDLQPNSDLKLYAMPQTDKDADMSWIGYGGQFSDGRNITTGGMNFDIRGKYNNPAYYCVVINQDQVVINSRDFEGIRFAGGEKRFPKDMNCRGN